MFHHIAVAIKIKWAVTLYKMTFKLKFYIRSICEVHYELMKIYNSTVFFSVARVISHRLFMAGLVLIADATILKKYFLCVFF